MFLPHFDVLCDLLKDRCTATWNLFVLYNKEFNWKAALFHVRRAKVGRSPFWKSRKKAIWRHLWSMQNEAISLVAVRWQRIVIGLGKSRHCQTWLECRFSWNENLQRRNSEGRIELRNLRFFKRMLEKSSQFLSLDQPNEPKSLGVPWVLQELKNTLGKLAIAVIRFEFWRERSVSDGGNLCSLWSVILKSVWNSVGDTFQLRYSWLWAAVSCILLAAVPWNGLEHSHQKARLYVYSIWF